MAYIENPIVEGKDFESVMNDINGNFSEIPNLYISNQYYNYQKLGELYLKGKPIIEQIFNVKDTITCSDIAIHVKGTLGANSQVMANSAHICTYSGSERSINYFRFFHACDINGTVISFNDGMENEVIYIRDNLLNISLYHYNGGSGGSATNSDLTVTLYGKKFDKAMCNLINA